MSWMLGSNTSFSSSWHPPGTHHGSHRQADTRDHYAQLTELLMQEGYDLGPKLGEGHFAIVYKAQSLQTGIALAAKVSKPSPQGSRRLARKVMNDMMREATYMAALQNHPRILHIYNAFEFEELGCSVIITARAEGTLQDLIDRGQMLGIEEQLQLFWDLIQAVHYLVTEMALCHRDIHPQNILFSTASGGRRRFLLGDFGRAARIGSTDGLSGHECYMPPEILSGMPPTPTTDIFSLFLAVCLAAGAVMVDGYGPTKDFSGVLMSEWSDFVECAHPDWRRRPSTGDLYISLEELHGSEDENSRMLLPRTL